MNKKEKQLASKHAKLEKEVENLQGQQKEIRHEWASNHSPHQIGDVLENQWGGKSFRVESLQVRQDWQGGWDWIFRGPMLKANGEPHATHKGERTIKA